jgi:predicted nucleic acid-binding protein
VIIVDASAVADLLLRTPRGIRVAERLLRSEEETLHAPHLLDIEVVHAIRRYVLAGKLSTERAQHALDDLMTLPLSRYPHTELLSRVWELRSSLTAYDAVYAALAEVLGAQIVTTDGRLSRAHGHDAGIELIEAG